MGRSTRGTPVAPPVPDPGFFGDDLDPETAALIKQLQEEDINAAPVATRRERKAPEVYKPPPPGVGGLAKSEKKEVKKDEPRATRGGAGSGKEKDKQNAQDDKTPGKTRDHKDGGSSRGKQGKTTGDADRPKLGRRSLDASAELDRSRGTSPVGSPGAWSEKPLAGYKKPQGKEYHRFTHHVNEVWVQSTQRAGGGDHSDHVFKRFDRNGVECAFENTGSKGEFVRGNLQPSLRSKKAVETYLERVAKAAVGKQGARSDGRKTRDATGAKELSFKEKASDKKDASAKESGKQGKDASKEKSTISSRDDRAAGKSERDSAADAKELPRVSSRETRERGGKPETAPRTEKAVPAKRGRKSGESNAVQAEELNRDEATVSGKAEASARETAVPRDPTVALYDPQRCRAFSTAASDVLEKHASYVLDSVSGHVCLIRSQIAAERNATPVKNDDGNAHPSRKKELRATPQMLPGGTYRLVCDRCSASIADGHRNCMECGSDYCVECCAEMRVPTKEKGKVNRKSSNSPKAYLSLNDPWAGVKCPGKCVAGDTGRVSSVSQPLAFKVRCVSVTTQRSLAVAKAMPDPLSDVDHMADTYGNTALKVRQKEADELKEWVKSSDAASVERFHREVFGEQTPQDIVDDAEARRAPTSEEWRHTLDAVNELTADQGGAEALQKATEAHTDAINRHKEESDPKDVCERCNASDASTSTTRLPHERLKIWSPSVDEVDVSVIGADRYETMLTHFQTHWKRGDPVIVRGAIGDTGATGKQSADFWAPASLASEMRATLPFRSAARNENEKSESGKKNKESLVLTDCGDIGNSEVRIDVEEFFEQTFKVGEKSEVKRKKQSETKRGLLRLRDWPGDDDFKTRAPRHAEAFMKALPFPEYTNAVDGPLNLSTSLPKEWVPPDLGPKTYVGAGRLEERGLGDCVTKLHQDASDVVNVLLHVGADAQEEGSGTGTQGGVENGDQGTGEDTTEFESEKSMGAVWDVFRREDVPALTEWLKEKWTKGGLQWPTQRKAKKVQEKAGEGAQSGRASGRGNGSNGNGTQSAASTQNDHLERLNHPIHDQSTYLTRLDLRSLEKDTGVKPWSFTQKKGDAVFVPAGCPHQVRNLRACLKLSHEFVSPESAGECLALARQLRQCGFEDKLQGRAMVMHAARVADQVLNHGKPRAFGPASAAAIAAHEAELAAAAAAAAAGAAPEAEEWAKEWDEHATADREDLDAKGDRTGKQKRGGKRVKVEFSGNLTKKGKTPAAAAADAKRAAAKAKAAADAADADVASEDNTEDDEEHDEMALLLMGLGDAPPKKGKRKEKARGEVKPETVPAKKQRAGKGEMSNSVGNTLEQSQAQAQAGSFVGMDFAALQQQQQVMLQAMQAQGQMFGGFNPAMAAAAVAAYGGVGFNPQMAPPAPVPPPVPPSVPSFGAPGAPSFFGGGGMGSGAPPPGLGFGANPHAPPNPVAFPPQPQTPSATEQARAMLILLTQNPGVALSVIQTQPHLIAVPEVKTVYDAYIANITKPPANNEGPN